MIPPTLTLITDTTLVMPNGMTRQGSVIIEGKRIGDILETTPGSLLLNQDNVQVISGKGQYLTPGLIDLQVNGAFGIDLNQGKIQDIQNVLSQLPRYGVTGILLTAISAPHTDMLRVVNTFEEAIHHKAPRQTRPLGIHLEGPFLNPKYRGTHPKRSIEQASVEDTLSLISPRTKQVTLAPELAGAEELIRHLIKQQIQVSAGHTDADTQTILKAMGWGLNCITHLYNAMRPFHHRDPGVVGVGLADPAITLQMIADGAHAHPYALEAVMRAKPLSKRILVSDAMALAGLPEGSQTHFAHQTVTLKNGQAINQEQQLAGSCALLSQCVNNVVNWDIATFAEAIQMASTNPAELIGEGHQLGKIASGYLADLVLWDETSRQVTSTWINGELVFSGQTANQPAMSSGL